MWGGGNGWQPKWNFKKRECSPSLLQMPNQYSSQNCAMAYHHGANNSNNSQYSQPYSTTTMPHHLHQQNYPASTTTTTTTHHQPTPPPHHNQAPGMHQQPSSQHSPTPHHQQQQQQQPSPGQPSPQQRPPDGPQDQMNMNNKDGASSTASSGQPPTPLGSPNSQDNSQVGTVSFYRESYCFIKKMFCITFLVILLKAQYLWWVDMAPCKSDVCGSYLRYSKPIPKTNGVNSIP